MNLSKTVVFLMMVVSVSTFSVNLAMSQLSVCNLFDVDAFMFMLKENDFQVGFVLRDSKETFQKLGFLKFKTIDAKLTTGIAFGRSFSVILKIDFNLYGLTPGNHSLYFLVNPEGSFAVLDMTQKFFVGDNAFSLSWHEEFGINPFGLGRICIRQKGFSYGVYRISDGIFPGVFLYSAGKTVEEGLFAGVGWSNGIAEFFSFRKAVGLKRSTFFFEPMLVVKQGELIPALRIENVGGGLSLDFFLMPGKVSFRADF